MEKHCPQNGPVNMSSMVSTRKVTFAVEIKPKILKQMLLKPDLVISIIIEPKMPYLYGKGTLSSSLYLHAMSSFRISEKLSNSTSSTDCLHRWESAPQSSQYPENSFKQRWNIQNASRNAALENERQF